MSELLIALAILGVIAIFTIPKVLQSQQDGKFKAIGKEAASAISGAFQAYKLNNQVTSSTKPIDLLPYFNYVALQTTGTIDQYQTGGTYNCTNTNPCLKLHNGAALRVYEADFGTGINPAIAFHLDPDGKETTTGSTTGPGKSVEFNVYMNGQITTWGTCKNPTTDGLGGNWTPDPSKDPSWFSWD